MKKGWTYKKLGEVCEVTDYVANGSFATLRENVTYYNEPNYALLVRLADYSSNFDSSKFVYVDKHSYDFLSKSSLFGGEIIMSNVGSIGKCFICPKLAEHMTIGPNSLLIRTPNNKFYLYYFKSKTFQKDLISITSSATLSKFNKTQLKTLSLPSPPLAEQQRIVSRLDSAFAHIDELKANAEKQLNDARALFQKALSKAMEPKEGWEEKTLGEISVIAGDYGLNVSSKPFDGVRYLRITDITDDGELNEDKVSANIVEGKKQDELKEGDVLFARTGATVGKTLVYRKDFGECLYAGYLIRYRIIENSVLPRFIHYITHSDAYYKWVSLNQEAAAQPNISAKKYNLLPIIYPSLSEQQRIVSRLDALSKNVKALEENQRKVIAECDALKQALLRKVFE